MRRRRPLIVWLCLLALVWCQVAMAAQACTGGEPVAGADCHGVMADEDADSGGSPECPTQDVTPDLGKLPTVAPLPGQTVFLRVVDGRSLRFNDFATLPGARAGPHVATLCQRLI
ncbi:MAG: hypothetical protein LKM32_11670 [Chiayiivirga sp.]|jgi:hypothetical protein|uniref:hypothetical protein n=1 Tax=Chiayiivirga sp. TaxID=2041042 RepID=UPI0025BD773A|nr:hypothetical protein [Chiayiivirga sp.]MCI1709706.1 hypothetical protein [Chiayiivirga sp.]MCI1730008.1 hypothetical protein [Chiayiivirga sp.]